MFLSKKTVVILLMLILPLITHAMSKDEYLNYLNYKNEYIKSDRELNEIYSAQIKAYEKNGGSFYGQTISKNVFLKKAQQTWIKFRDASCDYETYESQTGTGYQSIYIQCLLEKTNERIKYLKEND